MLFKANNDFSHVFTIAIKLNNRAMQAEKR